MTRLELHLKQNILSNEFLSYPLFHKALQSLHTQIIVLLTLKPDEAFSNHSINNSQKYYINALHTIFKKVNH